MLYCMTEGKVRRTSSLPLGCRAKSPFDFFLSFSQQYRDPTQLDIAGSACGGIEDPPEIAEGTPIHAPTEVPMIQG